MLRRLGPSAITAGETSSPTLWLAGLEFNPPAHGVWNIVHVGMLVPEAHQVYVCAVNCMRGVVLTAAEMGAADRFSCVLLKEDDITRGTVEEVTLEGVTDALRGFEAEGRLPPCVIVFPVCTHHFLGISMGHVYRELRRRFPGVDFVEAWMDPIMRRHRSPDQHLRQAMLDVLPECEADPALVAHLGSDFPLPEDSDLRQALGSTACSGRVADGAQEKAMGDFPAAELPPAGGQRVLACESAARGCRIIEVQDCSTYAEYKALARGATFVSTFPNARPGVERAARRLGRQHLYLPSSFDYAEIEDQHRRLAEALELPLINIDAERARCEEALADARAEVGDVAIAIDASFHPRPLGLARLLVEHGFRVTEVYVDAVTDEDAPALDWLRVHAPQVEFSAIVAPELRVAPRTREEPTLALGQKAAWFTGTAHFANVVEGGGLWGYAGIRELAALMREAWATEKDTRGLIPRKGLGCVSCI